MKIVREETLLSCREYAFSAEWKRTRKRLYKAIRGLDWPRGSGTFTIYPELGKGRDQGKGVIPIKIGLMEELRCEHQLRLQSSLQLCQRATSAVEEMLRQELRRAPDQTLAELKAKLRAEQGVELSVTQVRRMLQRLELRLKKVP